MDDLSDLSDLAAEIRRLSDIEEIRTLRNRYHTHVNERTGHMIGDLFTEDGEWDFGFVSRGTNVREYFAHLSTRSSFFMQFPHGHIVNVTGDTATGHCYQQAISVINGKAYTISGRYDDTYHRTPDGWRFRKMCFDARIFALADDQSWADPANRQVDAYGYLGRDSEGNLIIPATSVAS